MFIRTLIIAGFLSLSAAPAMANPGPGNKLHKLDRKLDRLERRGVIEQGSRLDKVEDRIDRREDRIDRREDMRDRAVNHGPLDRLEDRVDRLESRQDRRENRRDRRN